jgi:hypothetical protein
MNLNSQDYLAKLLAKENLTVEHGNYSTASFNVEDRVLRLPLWADKGKNVNDLLVGHEVGHALYTPVEGWHDCDKDIPGVPRSYVNVIEDIRIENKIQETYPGIVRAFKEGYKVLFNDGLFGKIEDIKSYNFIDRLNIHAKGRGLYPVEFTEVEQRFVDLAMNVKTWEDVLNASKEIADFVKNQEDYEDEQQQSQSSDGDQCDEQQSQSIDGQSEQNSNGCESAPKDEEMSDSIEDEEENTLESKTDQAQRDNEDSLLETDEYGNQPKYSQGISPANLDKIVIPYQELLKTRLACTKTTYYSEVELGYNMRANKDSFETFQRNNKKMVNSLVKEFERKKAAFEYSRSSESKKGSLNMNKLHQYEYSEDIFLTVRKLANSKSHGIFMILDWSGSMHNILTDVTKQAITIAEFCRRVNIPFVCYNFTRTRYKNKQLDVADNEIEDINNLKICEVIPQNLKKTEFNQALFHLYSVSENMQSWEHRNTLDQIDSMGSTPTVQTLIALAPVARAFRAKNGIEIMNTMIITDGDADHVDNHSYFNNYDVPVKNNRMKIKFGNENIDFNNDHNTVAPFIESFGRQTGSKMIGFYLAPKRADFLHAHQRANSFKNNHDFSDRFKLGVDHIQNSGGYSDYFIVKVDSKREEDNEFVLDEKKGHEIKDIKRQFRNFNKKQKGGKHLVAKITDAVAA